MKILYVIHSPPWIEYSGAPLQLHQYLKHAKSNGYQAAVLSKDIKKDGNDYVPSEYSGVRVFGYPAVDDWGLNAFRSKLRKSTIELHLNGFLPDIVHIIDWVGLHPAILKSLKNIGAPIIRHVLNFEDRCYFVTPVRRLPHLEKCAPPLAPNSCADCILNHYSGVKKDIKSLVRKSLKQLSPAYINYKHKINQMSIERAQIAERDIEIYYDFLIFPSLSFADYYKSHLKVIKPYKVCELGLPLPPIIPKREVNSQGTIKIMYAGGGSDVKGFHIVENAFLRLINATKVRFELRIYGVDKIQADKSLLKGYGNITFIDRFNIAEDCSPYTWADIGVVPTHFETFCRVAREYMIYGAVPVSTRAFGIAEVIKDEYNGLLINRPYNQSLFTAVLRLMEEKGLLQRLRVGLSNSKVVSDVDEFNEIKTIYEQLRCNKRFKETRCEL